MLGWCLGWKRWKVGEGGGSLGLARGRVYLGTKMCARTAALAAAASFAAIAGVAAACTQPPTATGEARLLPFAQSTALYNVDDAPTASLALPTPVRRPTSRCPWNDPPCRSAVTASPCDVVGVTLPEMCCVRTALLDP